MKIQPQERRRLRALESYRILDTAAEEVFDDLTRLAATICEAPISLVSLVDEKRQWFKSCFGLEATETPRAHAFCAHAIQSDDLMVIEDARRDRRFADNPLVLGEPLIRFYAGAPLAVETGERLGTLCIIDREVRVLASHQLEALAVLRDAVVAQLELRKAREDLQALRSLVPMCTWCRSVRVEGTGKETWQRPAEYLKDSGAVTRGICPSCRQELEGA